MTDANIHLAMHEELHSSMRALRKRKICSVCVTNLRAFAFDWCFNIVWNRVDYFQVLHETLDVTTNMQMTLDDTAAYAY